MGYFFCVTYKAISRLLWGYFKRQWNTSFLWHIYFIIVGVHRDKEYFFTLWALLYFYPLHCSLKDFDTELLNYISFNKSDPSCTCSVQHVISFLHYDEMVWHHQLQRKDAHLQTMCMAKHFRAYHNTAVSPKTWGRQPEEIREDNPGSPPFSPRSVKSSC